MVRQGEEDELLPATLLCAETCSADDATCNNRTWACGFPGASAACATSTTFNSWSSSSPSSSSHGNCANSFSKRCKTCGFAPPNLPNAMPTVKDCFASTRRPGNCARAQPWQYSAAAASPGSTRPANLQAARAASRRQNAASSSPSSVVPTLRDAVNANLQHVWDSRCNHRTSSASEAASKLPRRDSASTSAAPPSLCLLFDR
mmetsp:Transcript_69273/g.212395  ORF Transcript_69273/g.212395 Transcript_69273/m.212395 type:complete len:203 (+) Transcript_69273:817-1425(+)